MFVILIEFLCYLEQVTDPLTNDVESPKRTVAKYIC